MGLSKSELLLVFTVFYVVIAVFTVYLSGWQQVNIETNDITGLTSSTNALGINGDYDTQSGSISVWDTFIKGFSDIPWWANLIIFGPIGVVLLFILITTVGGALFDGGS